MGSAGAQVASDRSTGRELLEMKALSWGWDVATASRRPGQQGGVFLTPLVSLQLGHAGNGDV